MAPLTHTVTYHDPDGSRHSFELPDIVFAARSLFSERPSEVVAYYIEQDRMGRQCEAEHALRTAA